MAGGPTLAPYLVCLPHQTPGGSGVLVQLAPIVAHLLVGLVPLTGPVASGLGGLSGDPTSCTFGAQG